MKHDLFEKRLGEYIINKIHAVRPDLDIALECQRDDRYAIIWTGTLIASWGPLGDYLRENVHPAFVSYKIDYAGNLNIAGGGDGFFHCDVVENIDIPDAGSEQQLYSILPQLGRVLDAAIGLAQKIKPLAEADIPGYRKSPPVYLV